MRKCLPLLVLMCAGIAGAETTALSSLRAAAALAGAESAASVAGAIKAKKACDPSRASCAASARASVRYCRVVGRGYRYDNIWCSDHGYSDSYRCWADVDEGGSDTVRYVGRKCWSSSSSCLIYYERGAQDVDPCR
jgi:hypothetical protein